jgi:hypothetical protein
MYLSGACQNHRVSMILNRADQSEIGPIHGGYAASAVAVGAGAGAGGDRCLLVAASKF